MNIAAYCRVSTEKDEQLESLENQKIFFNEFAIKNNYNLVKIYADEGISGKQMKNRTEFIKMLEDSKLGLFNMVVVKDISRFSRNTVDFLNATRFLRSNNIEVLFLSNNQTVLGGSEFILTIFSALAQEESANLSKRVKFGKKVNAKKGRVPNIIYGYNQVDTFTLEINEDEAATVKKIFDLYVNQGYGLRKITNFLNNEQILSKKGFLWSPKTVSRILQNKIYIGILENNKYETIDFISGKKIKLSEDQYFIHMNPLLKIIDESIFLKAAKMIEERSLEYSNKKAKSSSRYSNKHLFSNLIKCGCCNGSYFRKVYTYKNTFIKWKCTSHNQKGNEYCSNSVSIDEQELIIKIEEYLKSQITQQDDFIESIKSECKKELLRLQNDLSLCNIKKKLNKLKALEAKQKKMLKTTLLILMS